MSGFKAGDLALIINANNQENIGKTVELLREDSNYVIDHRPFEEEVTLNRDIKKCWLIRGDIVAARAGGIPEKCSIGATPEKWLMPLRRDFQPESQIDSEVMA